MTEEEEKMVVDAIRYLIEDVEALKSEIKEMKEI